MLFLSPLKAVSRYILYQNLLLLFFHDASSVLVLLGAGDDDDEEDDESEVEEVEGEEKGKGEDDGEGSGAGKNLKISMHASTQAPACTEEQSMRSHTDIINLIHFTHTFALSHPVVNGRCMSMHLVVVVRCYVSFLLALCHR